MSHRAKRPNRSEDGCVPVKRRKRTAAEEEEAATLAASWQPRANEIKSSSIYNRTTTEAPAELFRKDLISAMKLPDSEPLASNEYWVIIDQWKQEWERGVQVPVNPDSLPEPSVCVAKTPCVNKSQHEFKLPKNKYIRITKDANFDVEEHALSNAPTQAEAACSYDLDEGDSAWLRLLNAERSQCGQGPVSEDQLERVIEQLESTCWDKIQTILRNEEGLGIEYDENVICDVCRSPDSEEGNEMVFCDSCNICVHQACYGITRIPDGQWLCCTCHLGQRPKCVLCPNKGGAMKCTRSGQKWAHVSCALWIPEVSIGCVEKMEPITKISSIPQSRWALICVLCRERVGACIQCSVKTCKTAYHVTCAFKHGLEMRAIIEDENADDGVKLRSYCEKHSKSSKKEKSVHSGSEDDDSKRKKRKDMTSEEKNQARAARLQEIEAEFFRHVTIKDVGVHLDVDGDALRHIYNYWKLKRKAGRNKPLLPPKSEDVDVVSHKREQADLEKMKMFVQLRQDLERVRNLCYMVSRREKLSRSFFKLREQTFHKQVAVLGGGQTLPHNVVDAVVEANHGPSIYDRLYSHADSEDRTDDFEKVLMRIAGIKSPTDSGDEKRVELNGLFKSHNPYKKTYFNGTSKRRSASLYGTSSSSDEKEKPRPHIPTSSSSEPEDQKKKSPRKLNNKVDRHHKRLSASSKLDSSSEEDIKPPVQPQASTKTKKNWSQYPRSRLMQVERELGYSGSDSDELMPIKSSTSTNKPDTIKQIYSDSDSSDASVKNKVRTKAAVKEFSHKPSGSKKAAKNEAKTKDYVGSELIVPQRQAAKKATENLKSTTANRAPPLKPEEEPKVVEEKEKVSKPKPKVAKKEVKEAKPKNDVFDLDKEPDSAEILAYVPQRQAAKKAAEHIKSGLGKPAPPPPTSEETTPPKKKEAEKPPAPAKVSESKRKSSSNSSSSSSSSSSTDSSSSSGSESEEPSAPTNHSQLSAPRSESIVSTNPFKESSSRETAKRTHAKDWPFLDKAAKPTAASDSSSSPGSDSTDSSRSPSPAKQNRKTGNCNNKKPQQQQQRNAVEREEQPRTQQQPLPPQRKRNVGRKKPSPKPGGAERLNAHVKSRNLSDSQRGDGKCGKGKPGDDEEETKKSGGNRLQSPIKDGKKLNFETSPKSDLAKLEKEILERKAGKQGTSKTRSTLDRLFGSPDKKEEKKSPIKTKPARSTVKENKEPEAVTMPVVARKSPLKAKSIDEIFTAKTVLNENKIEVTPKREEVLNEMPKIDDCKPKPEETENKNPRSIFSPPHFKDNFLDFDHLDDGFGISKDEELMKGPLTFNFGNTSLFKEDSKEDSARETLNLVEKLRMGMEMTKKSGNSCDVDDVASVVSGKTEIDRNEFAEQVVPSSNVTEECVKKVDEVVSVNAAATPPTVNLEMRVEVTEIASEQKSFEPREPYVSCEADVPVPIQQHHGLVDQAIGGDERWVPPSGHTGYNDEQTIEPPTYSEPPLPLHTSFIPQQYSKPDLPPLLPQLELRLTEEARPSPIPHHVSQTPLTNDATSMDCMPSPSPYGDIHPQAKWADSEIMPNRRSSSSSAASTSSRNDEDDSKPRPDHVIMNHQTLDMAYLPRQYPPEPPFPVFTEPSQFVGAVSPFPPPSSLAMFPPAAFGAPMIPVMPALPPKPEVVPFTSTCTAAFTSSQHNMALTMVSLATPPAEEEPRPISPKPDKKSPTKPTRTSARVTSQGKSPKMEVAKVAPTRGRGKKCQNVRGRGGRGRGRGRTHDFESNTIHNKLVGTVYDLDFEDDISENVDLKAMRERRKSADLKNDVEEGKKYEVAAPAEEETSSFESKAPEVDPILPVLPGPVDMRTYSGANFDGQNYNEANLLKAFATGTTERPNEDIDEEFEKELQTALTTPKVEPAPIIETNSIKPSLSDSRNQLKVKIKGPIANYSSNIPPLPAPIVNASNFTPNNAITNNSIGSGTSNLRRMRKKELLRQYWNQDANLDDTSCAPATPAAPPMNRTIITIPKAVASMTSIPTKDDYRDYRTTSDDLVETKHRKETKARPGALSRELRQLDLPLDELERRRSANNLSGPIDAGSNKRRGRPPRPAPKIKIKIGDKTDDRKDKVRPPKKRLANISMPSVEDLKRESMKYRKLMMAELKEKRKKKDKKRKKEKQMMQVISNESENPTKLIIRIGKKCERTDESVAEPIKLKLSRCQEGSGYVMKRDEKTDESVSVAPPALPLTDCEVR